MPDTARLRGCDLTVFYWIFWGRLETTLTGHVSYRFLLWCYFLISYIFLFGAISYFLPISFPAPITSLCMSCSSQTTGSGPKRSPLHVLALFGYNLCRVRYG